MIELPALLTDCTSIPRVAPRRAVRLESWLPSRCQICHAWPAAPLCGTCVARFAAAQPRCGRCALPIGEGTPVCGACLHEPSPLDACLSAVSYAWPWSECLGRLKFQRSTGLAGALAALLMRTPGVVPALARAHWVIPLPLSRQRLAERGYNQALLLARKMVSRGIRTDLLVRVRHTPPQRTMSREDRLRSTRGAFSVDPTKISILRGRRVVLVDDVMTTGATLRAAASVLRQAGVAHITGIVVARTPDDRS